MVILDVLIMNSENKSAQETCFCGQINISFFSSALFFFLFLLGEGNQEEAMETFAGAP